MSTAGVQVAVPTVLMILAESIRLVDGDAAEAMQLVETGLRLAIQSGQPYWDPELHRLKGELLLASGNDADAETAFELAIETAGTQGAKLTKLRAAMLLASFLQARGRVAEARSLLEPIYRDFTEGHETQILKDAGALLEGMR